MLDQFRAIKLLREDTHLDSLHEMVEEIDDTYTIIMNIFKSIISMSKPEPSGGLGLGIILVLT